MKPILTVALMCGLVLSSAGCRRSLGDYLKKGNEYHDSGKYADASIQYRKALQRDPNSGEAHYRLALSEIKLNRLNDAHRLLRRAVELMPDHQDAKARLADLSLVGYLADSRRPKVLHDEVAKLADQLLAKNPSSFDGLRLKGSLALLDRKPVEAIARFRKANQIKPGNRDLLLSLVQALFQNAQPEEGEKLALELIGKEKTFGAIYDVLYLHYRRTGRPADAERILLSKVDNNPKRADVLLELAGHYAGQKKAQEATSTLKRLLDNPEDFPRARLMVGDFYRRTGNLPEAIRHYEEGAKTASADERAAYQKRIADALAAQGKRAEALQVVEALLKEQPKDDDARLARAALLLESGKADAALPELEGLVKTRPQDPGLRFSLGRAHLSQGNAEQARTQFQESIRIRQDFIPPRLALASLALAQRKPQDVLRYADEILSLDTRQRPARLLRAISLSGLGRYDEARAELSRGLRDSPNDREAALQLGLVAIAERKFKEAEEIFNKLREAHPEDMRATAGLAEAYTSQSQFERALRLTEANLKKSPESPASRSLLALAAMRAGNYDLAIEQYRQLLALNPKSPEVHLRLAEAYRSKNDLASAIQAFEKVRELAPKDPRAPLMLAGMLESAGRFQEAISHYQQVLELQPNHIVAANNLAYLLAETGSDLERALALARRSVEKAPGQPNFADTLGWIYLKKGMPDSALQVFQGLVRQNPKNPTFRYHLAVTLLQKGDKVRARSELQQALANQPRPEQEQKIRELIKQIG